MKLRALAIIGTLTLISGTLGAGFSGTLSLTSDYDYRGFSQSAEDFAIQGSLDYAHDSGFYASAWGSSLDWGSNSDADIEIDYFIGYGREIGDSGFAWDVGYLAYTYPEASNFNFGEFYGGISKGPFSVKVSYSDDFAGVGESAWYVDGAFGHEWASGFSILVYGGYSFGNAFDVVGPDPFGFIPTGFPDFWNYGAGVGYSLGDHLYLEAKVVGTDLSGAFKNDSGVFANDLRGVFTMTLSIP